MNTLIRFQIWYLMGTFKQFITYTENGLNRSREIYKRLFTYYNNGNIKEEKITGMEKNGVLE